MGKYKNLGLLATEGAKTFMGKVDSVLSQWSDDGICQKNGYVIHSSCPRFGSGEGKGLISETVRDKDLYLFVDVTNSSITYKMDGYENRMSPDDHYSDLKRLICACNGKAKITVIMPFLYEGRQHRRTSRESLDCAMMLQELAGMGVSNIITFDAHDPRVQNAMPLNSLENVRPAYQVLESLFSTVNDIQIDDEHLMIVSPDEGATDRAIYIADLLGVNVGMFYKRRDYTKIVDGRNPIVAHEFIGENVKGKDVIVVDDMISSGDSMIDVAKQLKKRGAGRIFINATFGLFTSGLDRFDDAVESGIVDKLITTNLVYQKQAVKGRDYYISVDMHEYVAAIISQLNEGASISKLIDPAAKIKELVHNYK